MKYFWILGLLISYNICFAGKPKVLVEVSNEYELVKALGPNKIIYLNTGKYNISINDSLTQLSKYFTRSKDIWPNTEIRNLENLTLIGKGKVDIVINNPYEWAMVFINCKNISLENLYIGHETDGECMGGAAYFENSSDINIKNVGLYGCGTTGLELYGVHNITVTNSEIFKCTYHLVTINNSTNVQFQKVKFRDSGKFEMLSFDNNHKVLFRDCEFSNNTKKEGSIWDNTCFIEVKEAVSPIDFEKCQFNNNKYKTFCSDLSPIRIISCSFKNNIFEPVAEKISFSPSNGGMIKYE